MDKDLNIIYIANNYMKSTKVELTGSLVKIKLLTVGDEAKIFDWEMQGNDSYLYELALIMDNDKTVEENLEFLRELSVKDLQKIEEAQKKCEHGVDMRVDYVCKECGGRGKFLVPFRFKTLFSFE